MWSSLTIKGLRDHGRVPRSNQLALTCIYLAGVNCIMTLLSFFDVPRISLEINAMKSRNGTGGLQVWAKQIFHLDYVTNRLGWKTTKGTFHARNFAKATEQQKKLTWYFPSSTFASQASGTNTAQNGYRGHCRLEYREELNPTNILWNSPADAKMQSREKKTDFANLHPLRGAGRSYDLKVQIYLKHKIQINTTEVEF